MALLASAGSGNSSIDIGHVNDSRISINLGVIAVDAPEGEPDPSPKTDSASVQRRIARAKWYYSIIGKSAFEAGQAAATREADLVFRPDGNGYFIKRFDESGHFSMKGTKGLHDLFKLIQVPDIGILMTDLDGVGTQQSKKDPHSRQPVADGETFNQIAAERKRHQMDLENADNDLDRTELQQKIEKLDAAAMQLKGIKGKPRDLNNPFNKLRPKIFDRIKTAINEIRPTMPAAAEHFDLAIKSESGRFIYSPDDPNVKWDTLPKK